MDTPLSQNVIKKLFDMFIIIIFYCFSYQFLIFILLLFIIMLLTTNF